MSVRGTRRGRPRGSRNGNGRGRGKGKTTVWEWESYKPGPEVYNNLFRLHKAPPTITHTLPNDCPIPHARSRIINRKQSEDGFCRNYYAVRITYLATKSDASGSDDDEPSERETIRDVDISQILKFVSPRELERFENAEFKAEAEAEAAAERAEAEELARRRLEKNTRVPGAGHGNRMLGGLGLDPEVRLRGRPPGRGRGRPRGRPRGSFKNGLAAQSLNQIDDDLKSEEVMEVEPSEAVQWGGADLQGLSTDSEEDLKEDLPLKQPSPDLARSSFVANSALPVSPIAAHRSIAKPSLLLREVPDVGESDLEEDDTRSLSSAAAQLQFERETHSQHILDSEVESEDEDRHRTKRRRTESTSSSRPHGLSAKSRQPFAFRNSMIKLEAETPASDSMSESDESSEGDTLHVKPASRFPNNMDVDHRQANGRDADNDDEDDDSETEEYIVEAIINHSHEDGKKYYLVKWQGDEDSSDWLPEEDLAGAAELVTEYNERIKRRKEKRPMR